MNILEKGPSMRLSQWYNTKCLQKILSIRELLKSHSKFHAIILGSVGGYDENLALTEYNNFYSFNNLFLIQSYANQIKSKWTNILRQIIKE